MNAHLCLGKDSSRRLNSLLRRSGSLGLDVLNLGRLFVNLVGLSHCNEKTRKNGGV